MSTRRSVRQDAQPVDVGLVARLNEAEHLIGTLRDRATVLHATVLVRDQEIADLRAQLTKAQQTDEQPARRPATKKASPSST